MKKFITMLLIIATLLSLSACGSKDKETTPQESTPQVTEPVETLPPVRPEDLVHQEDKAVCRGDNLSYSVSEKGITNLTTFVECSVSDKEADGFTGQAYRNLAENIMIFDNRSKSGPFKVICEIKKNEYGKNVYFITIQYSETQTFEKEFDGKGIWVITIQDDTSLDSVVVAKSLTIYAKVNETDPIATNFFFNQDVDFSEVVEDSNQ